MGKQTINNLDLLVAVRTKINDNFNELYTSGDSTYTTVNANSALWASNGGSTINTVTLSASTANFGVTTETWKDLNIVSNATSLDLSKASFFTLTLNDNVSAFFVNPPSYGRVCTFTLATSADGTSRTVTWPKTIKWPSGIPPVITSTAGSIDIFSFLTYDGGSSYIATRKEQNFPPLGTISLPPPATPAATPTSTPAATPAATPPATPPATPTSTPAGGSVVVVGLGGSGYFNGSGYFTENSAQQINMTALTQAERIYLYDNYDGTTLSYTNTVIIFNGTARASISHTTDRIGDAFGYSLTGSTPQSSGILTGGTVYIS